MQGQGAQLHGCPFLVCPYNRLMLRSALTPVFLLCLMAGSAWAQPAVTTPVAPPSPGSAGTGQTAPDQDPQEQYELAKNAFYYQDYERTILLLTPLLAPTPRLSSKEQMLHAREMLGASLWWRKEVTRFREQFTRLLQDNPRFELDAFYYPPEMVRDFSELKQQLVDAGLIQVPAEDPGRKVRVETVLYDYTPLGLAFVPFGVGQFANGDTGAGILFLSLESTFLALNIATWTWMYAANPHGTERTVGLGLLYGSLGLLTTSAIWGIIDAVVDHQPERFIRRDANDQEAMLPDDPWLAPSVPSGLSAGWGWIGWQALF